MIAIHIIQPISFGPASVIDQSLGDYVGFSVRALNDNLVYAETNSHDTEAEAIAVWNSAFSSAPIQYTDKGKVCD